MSRIRPTRIELEAKDHDDFWQAGFFIRLVAADVLGGETNEVGLPCCLVLTFTQDLCMVSQLQMICACGGFLVLTCFGSDWNGDFSVPSKPEVSRVHSDMLRTLVVGPGLCGEAQISLSLDTCGTLVFQCEDQQLLCLNVGTAFRGELTLWQMLLRGKDERIFRSMNVEDSEATLSEHLGVAAEPQLNLQTLWRLCSL